MLRLEPHCLQNFESFLLVAPQLRHFMMNTPSVTPIPSGKRKSDTNVKYTIRKCFAMVIDLEFAEYYRKYYCKSLTLFEISISGGTPSSLRFHASEVTLSGFAGGECLPLPASKGPAFPFPSAPLRTSSAHPRWVPHFSGKLRSGTTESPKKSGHFSY